jgi:hypothetical protein
VPVLIAWFKWKLFEVLLRNNQVTLLRISIAKGCWSTAAF